MSIKTKAASKKPNHYDSIAPSYDFIARLFFRNEICRAQTFHLSTIQSGGQALFLGGGSNTTLKKLLNTSSQIQVDYIEPSKPMISKVKRNLSEKERSRVNFICGSHECIPPKQYDYILCFFFLDLFKPIDLWIVLDELKQRIKPTGRLFVADFVPAKTWWQHLIEKPMFLFLKYSTNIESNRIEDLHLALIQQQFKEENKKLFFGNYIFSSTFKQDTRNNTCREQL